MTPFEFVKQKNISIDFLRKEIKVSYCKMIAFLNEKSNLTEDQNKKFISITGYPYEIKTVLSKKEQESLKLKNKVYNHLKNNPNASIPQLIEITGLGESTIRKFIYLMLELKEVHISCLHYKKVPGYSVGSGDGVQTKVLENAELLSIKVNKKETKKLKYKVNSIWHNDNPALLKRYVDYAHRNLEQVINRAKKIENKWAKTLCIEIENY